MTVEKLKSLLQEIPDEAEILISIFGKVLPDGTPLAFLLTSTDPEIRKASVTFVAQDPVEAHNEEHRKLLA